MDIHIQILSDTNLNKMDNWTSMIICSGYFDMDTISKN